MSSIIQILRRIGGTKAPPTSGNAGQLAVWKAGTTLTDEMSMYFHDGAQWVDMKIGPTYRGETAPTSHLAGDLWFKPSTAEMFLWDTNQWRKIAFTNVANTFTENQNITGRLTVSDRVEVNQMPGTTTINANWDGQITLQGPLYRGGISTDAAGLWVGHASTSHSIIFRAGKDIARMWPTGETVFNSASPVWGGGIVQASNIGIVFNASVANTDAAGAGLIINRTASEGWLIGFNKNTASVGNINVSATGTVGYNTTSDYRLKENIVPLTDASDRVMQLKPSRFNFKSAPGMPVDGFIAHEVETVVPEAVTGKKDGVGADGQADYQSMDASKLVPLLTAALQDALKRIAALEARP